MNIELYMDVQIMQSTLKPYNKLIAHVAVFSKNERVKY